MVLHGSLDIDMFIKRSGFFFIIIDKTVNKGPSHVFTTVINRVSIIGQVRNGERIL